MNHLVVTFCLLYVLVVSTSAETQPLHCLSELVQLPRCEAAKGLPVVAQGVVTRLNGVDGFFMHRDGADLYVGRTPRGGDFPPSERLPQMEPGTLVEVEGVTEAGAYKPMIRGRYFRVIGRERLPEAQQTNLNLLTSGDLECCLIKVTGVVQAIRRTEKTGAPYLRVSFEGSPGMVEFAPEISSLALEPLLDAKVEVEGVLAVISNLRGEVVGFRILVSGLGDFTILEKPSADPFQAAPIPLEKLGGFNRDGGSQHRIVTTGIVTYQKPGDFIVIQNAQVATRIATRTGDVFQPGERVVVSGFRELSRPVTGLTEALVRRTSIYEPLDPVPRNASEIFNSQNFLARRNRPQKDCDYQLVTMNLTLKEVRVEGGGAELLMDQGNVLVSAKVPVTSGEAIILRKWRPDSLMEVTGVCELGYSGTVPTVDYAKTTRIGLLCRTPADFKIVRAATWWTRDRLMTSSAITGVLICGFLIWNMALRRRVDTRSRELAAALKDQHDIELEFEAVRGERQRLAADLHDLVSQGISAAAMQMETAHMYEGRNPELVITHSATARELLSRCREDVRRSLWGLRADVLDGHSFPQALQSLVRRLTSGTSLHVLVDCAPEAGESLPDVVAGNLLILVQEALSNALRHSEATELSISFRNNGSGVVLIVEDTGKGFIPTVESCQQGHFGLHTMQGRIERLRGNFQLATSPGSGTRITVTIPLEAFVLAAELTRAR